MAPRIHQPKRSRTETALEETERTEGFDMSDDGLARRSNGSRMKSIHTLEPHLSQKQPALFRSAAASRAELEDMLVLRAGNLALIEKAGWKRESEIVCMFEECYTELEIWTRKKKGKRIERKYLDRNTLILHEHSDARQSGSR